MNLEINRLESFVSFSTSFLISIQRFANAGLYYEGEGDSVRCFSCGGIIRDWRSNDSPKRRHKTEYPHCRFVLGKDNRNIPLTAMDSGPIAKTEISKHSPIRSGPTKESKQTRILAERGSDCSNNKSKVKMFSADELTYRSEFNRLQTFQKWPLSSEVNPYELAAGGLFCCREGVVKCFACFVEIKNQWRTGERPSDKHRLLSPSCPFVKGKTTNNEPMSTRQKRLAVIISQSKYPEYFTQEGRLSTYQNWPKAHPQRPTNLAEAGFFANDKDDMVTCFCCGCRLLGWEETDDPWEEHAAWSPECHWLKFERRVTKPSTED
ncbi:baculoviral IAP repeat-containing protein 2-like [Apostichopus japonicus]|uniref:baculoviral IAP repeat-containing protein 2-like n=1 Tax=Stichopus japonicus TaxID=307972 RepID=UPI003AB1764D